MWSRLDDLTYPDPVHFNALAFLGDTPIPSSSRLGLSRGRSEMLLGGKSPNRTFLPSLSDSSLTDREMKGDCSSITLLNRLWVGGVDTRPGEAGLKGERRELSEVIGFLGVAVQTSLPGFRCDFCIEGLGRGSGTDPLSVSRCFFAGPGVEEREKEKAPADIGVAGGLFEAGV